MYESPIIRKCHFGFFERAGLRLLKLLCPRPDRFVYGMKFLGFEDNRAFRALEVVFGFAYEDAKMTVAELMGAPYVSNKNKSRTLNQVCRERSGQKQVDTA